MVVGRQKLEAEGFCSLAQLIEGRLTSDDLKELSLNMRDRKVTQVR